MKFLDSDGLQHFWLKIKNTFALKSHTHEKSQITDFPTSMKNPSSLKVQLNSGTSEGTNQFTYDGSGAKNINITPSAIGAAAASHGTHVTYGTETPEANGTASAGNAATVSRSDHVHPLQTSVSGNAGTATKLAAKRTIDGVNFDGSSNIIHYGECSTAAATAAKTVGITNFILATGAIVFVKFTVTNTASNPTLNVNSTGAKAIYYRGSAISTGYLAANRVYMFVYDGTYYQFVGDINTENTYTHPTTPGNKHIPSGGSSGQILRWASDGTATWGADNDTTYSDMKGATSSASGSSGLVPAPAAGKQTSFLRGDGTWVVPPNTTYDVATSSKNGLMSSTDKAKLDSMEAITEEEIDSLS